MNSYVYRCTHQRSIIFSRATAIRPSQAKIYAHYRCIKSQAHEFAYWHHCFLLTVLVGNWDTIILDTPLHPRLKTIMSGGIAYGILRSHMSMAAIGVFQRYTSGVLVCSWPEINVAGSMICRCCLANNRLGLKDHVQHTGNNLEGGKATADKACKDQSC